MISSYFTKKAWGDWNQLAQGHRINKRQSWDLNAGTHKLNHHRKSSPVLGSRHPETSVGMSKGSLYSHPYREEILKEKGRGGPALGQQGARTLLWGGDWSSSLKE